jgi:hypothetical protein
MKRSKQPKGKEEPKVKVWALDTDEPLYQRFETGIGGIGSLYSTKKKAEQARKEYEKEFGPGSAWVVDLEVERRTAGRFKTWQKKSFWLRAFTVLLELGPS